ncbi:uncharacterized protein LOC144368003 [Ictidomys tridecemlineatus]
MAARAALSPGPGGRRFQAHALRRRQRRRPQPWPLCGSRAAAAPWISVLGPPHSARQSRSAPQPARTRPDRAPPVPARVSASPPLGSAPPSARPGAAAATAAPPVRSARPNRFPAPLPAASAARTPRAVAGWARAAHSGPLGGCRPPPGGDRALEPK